ncbi:MAG: TonB family protein [Bacteroides sp.]|nr:TonB family protein [Bacteroides sp.]
MTLSLFFLSSLVCSAALMLMYGAVRLTRVHLTPYGRPSILMAVLIAVIAAILPLIIGWHSRPFFVIDSEPELANQLSDSTLSQQALPAPSSTLTAWNILSIIYLIGLIIALLRFSRSLLRIILIIKRSEPIDDVLISPDKNQIAFTWAKWIIMSPIDYQTNGEILKTHEATHKSARHWIDLLFLNIIGCLTWYCPVITMLRRLLQTAHEFQADRAVLNAGFDPKYYQLLLISKASGRRFANSVADSIINHPLKQRIIMMQKKSLLSHGLLRSLALLPVGISVLTLASSSILASQAEAYMPEKIITVEDDATLTDDDAAKTEDDNAVFTTVEIAPQYPGGEMAMYEYLAKNIRYPKECAERNIQGKVIVSFVVKADGSIGDAKVVKSVDPQLDGEAIRIVRTFPKFTPGKMQGKPVNVWYTLPVNFKLQS